MQVATAQEMHTEQRKFNPPLGAMALRFFHSERNGHPIIGHGGIQLFSTDLQLQSGMRVGAGKSAQKPVAAESALGVLQKITSQRTRTTESRLRKTYWIGASMAGRRIDGFGAEEDYNVRRHAR
jgi:hypothetical protein